jgi:hypothetical protein
MNSLLDPLLAILVIVVPIGLAYIVIMLQARKPPSVWLNVSPMARDKLSKKGRDLSCTRNKSAAG